MKPGIRNASIILLALAMLAALGMSLRSTAQAAPPLQVPIYTPTPGPDGRIIYIVQANDTLLRISLISGVPVDQLRALNNLTGDTIYEGQRLLLGLSGPAEVVVTPGPTSTPGISASRLRPHGCDNGDSGHNTTFGVLSHGFCTRCLRFVPPSLTTTQDSLPAGCQPLPDGTFTHWVPTKGFEYLLHTHPPFLGFAWRDTEPDLRVTHPALQVAISRSSSNCPSEAITGSGCCHCHSGHNV